MSHAWRYAPCSMKRSLHGAARAARAPACLRRGRSCLWSSASEYASATSNTLAEATASLQEKLKKRQPELDRLAAQIVGVQTAEVVTSEVLGVDQLGFDVRVDLAGGSELRRVGFNQPPQNLEEALSLFMKLFQEAWERENGLLE